MKLPSYKTYDDIQAGRAERAVSDESEMRETENGRTPGRSVFALLRRDRPASSPGSFFSADFPVRFLRTLIYLGVDCSYDFSGFAEKTQVTGRAVLHFWKEGCRNSPLTTSRHNTLYLKILKDGEKKKWKIRVGRVFK